MLLSGHKHAQAYNQAMQFAKDIYRFTTSFPDTERVVLHDALRRLAVALCQTLATALAAKGKRQRRLLMSCLESCIALDAQLEIAGEVGFITEDLARETATRLHKIYNTLSGLLPVKKE